MKRPGVKMGQAADKSNNTHETGKYYLPKRIIVVVLGFLGVLIHYALRGDLSVAMVAMVNSTKHTFENNSLSSKECPVSTMFYNNSEKKVFKSEVYNWDSITQGYIMSAYFYCYFITVLTGGYFAERFGATRMFGGGVLVESVLSLLIPVAAKWGIIPFIIMRSLQGICGGVIPPAMSAVISRWSPKLERSFITTVIFTGSPMSTVIANPISGWLATRDFLGGWPAIFYISGLAGCIWFAMWFIFVYESPGLHPNITDDELHLFPEECEKIGRKKPDVPWKAIITSLPFWSVLLAQCGAVFTAIIMYTELPTYLSTVLHFNIKASGGLSTLPFLAETIGAWIASFVADRMRASGRWGITTIRKFFNNVAGYVVTVCLLAITLCGCNSALIIGLLTFGLFVDGLKFAGYHATTIDMSTDFAGTLYGLEYGTSCLFAILGPPVVGAFTVNGATVKNWSKVFYITAALKFATTTFYTVFASAETQPWGKAASKDIDKQTNTQTKF